MTVTEVKPIIEVRDGELTGTYDALASIQSFDWSTPVTDEKRAAEMRGKRADLNRFIKQGKSVAKAEEKELVKRWKEENSQSFAALDTMESIFEDAGEQLTEFQNSKLSEWLPTLEGFVQKQNETRKLDDDHKLTITKWRKIGSFTATGKLKHAIENEIVKEAELRRLRMNQPPKLTEKEVFEKAIKYKFGKLWDSIDDDGLYGGKDIKEMLKPIAEALNN
ncbi:hypothetical protein [Convivina praedatoris]|uniref:hypothetical protein n=1 Tax=Convivina praedatoris TaxID=2880963 RepID=UPI00200DAC4C|nr:hypothetical protein [Convivina sp. LMG 32447]CAH1855975.1 hypothetical protein R078138_01232 [Convivina sp. LMG 32447]